MASITESVQPGYLILFAVLCLLSYCAYNCVYNVYFHPLRKYPGPKYATCSYLWQLYYLNKGTLQAAVTRLHEKYGPVVRITPTEISYIDPHAWQDVYGVGVKPEMQRDPMAYNEPPGSTLITMQTDDHRAVRRALGHAFSDKALRDQEPIIMQYLNLFVKRLYDAAGEGNNAVDMVAWFNFFTFDVIGDLAFGEPFGCLQNSSYHFWVSMIFSQLHFTAADRTLKHYFGNEGLVRKLFGLLIPAKVAQEVAEHRKLTFEKMERRMAREDERPDFMEKLIRSTDKLPQLSLPATASILIIAGSETTATWLSGTMFHLLRTPRVLDKVVKEVRDAFEKPEEITMLTTARLKYMSAVLEESLRIYPPAPNVLPRKVPEPGAMIAGQWVPGGTTVGVPHYAAYHSSGNFSRPEEFIPERWMGDEEFANDQREAFKPFSFGPRNCIGKNLAYAEARLAFASVLWHFDLKLAPESYNWTDQVSFVVWQKHPLKVHLAPRSHVE